MDAPVIGKDGDGDRDAKKGSPNDGSELAARISVPQANNSVFTIGRKYESIFLSFAALKGSLSSSVGPDRVFRHQPANSARTVVLVF